jgi:PIN domain nuclease of toxin-antitoxin system
MKLLLDTHTFIWWDSNPDQLSTTAFAYCSDPANELILSVASLWEIQIKQQIGKLTLKRPIADIVANQQTSNGIIILPVMSTHIFALDDLPATHKDPFDRLLVAQAISEGATIVSVDSIFASYPVPVLW